MLGADETTWAFDGYNVSKQLKNNIYWCERLSNILKINFDEFEHSNQNLQRKFCKGKFPTNI